EYPRAIFVLAPLALLDVSAKEFGFRTLWHNLALRLPVRAELRTVLPWIPPDFFADFLAALVVAVAAPDVRTSHTLGIRLARLRRPVTWEIRRVSPLSLGSSCLATSCTAWLSLIWAKVLRCGRCR